MKKIIQIFAFVLISNVGYSQINYSNYLDDSCEWRGLGYSFDGNNYQVQYGTTYFDGFETINGYVYHKEYIIRVFEDYDGQVLINTTTYPPTTPNYVREDNTGKFYRYSTVSGIEEMFFDNQLVLNANIGNQYSDTFCAVGNITTDYLGTTPLTHVNGVDPSFNSGMVEGIGIIGSSCGVSCNIGGYLYCYTKNGNTIQFGSSSIDCSFFPSPLRPSLSTNSNILSKNTISITPNPSNGLYKIDFQNAVAPSNTIEVYNLLGQKIYENTINITNTYLLDLTNIASGSYLLKISNKEEVISKKLIKQ